MESTAHRAIAIVGLGAVLPDAPNAAAFWENIRNGQYSITEVTPDRWDPADYYDPDPAAPDKAYSKIGGWVRNFVWDPMKWRLPLPPRVVEGMDEAQKWAIACTREALEDYGYPKRPLDLDRTAVILGNAMAGEKHYLTALRVYFPEYAHELEKSASFAALPETVRNAITRELHERIGKRLPLVTEDSMPGELANCIAGRIANLFNFHGPNYVTDAACASAMAAISSAAEGLIQNNFDVAITGGIDRNMGAPTFVKFCKIGALSGTGTRPYAEGADGFVMGEGAVIFLLKRLADAERNGDKVYAVLRGIGGSSDGKGKGITAPNPIGQRLAVERGWQNAGLSPATATYVEGHGTSTRVGDVVEVQSLIDVLCSAHLPAHSLGLGSVKSNIGHLKGAAGGAGLLKTTLMLRDKVLPPSIHCERRNPDIDFDHSPVYVNTELQPWTAPADGIRRAGVSAFGFGGTNFHLVLEEHVPGRLTENGKRSVAVPEIAERVSTTPAMADSAQASAKAPLRGALVIGAASDAGLTERLQAVQKEAAQGRTPAPAAPLESDLRAPERLAIDFADTTDLAAKCAQALKAVAANQPMIWKALRAQGIFRGHGPAPKVAFLYTGQGSQYVNMLKPLCTLEPIVAETFAEADRVMTPLLGKPLSDFIFVDGTDADATAKAEADLRQTAITQPAVLATDLALTRLLAAYGIEPDMTMGHSLGEYGALVVSGALPFAEALQAVSARGRGMTHVSVADNGKMAAVFAPLQEIERLLKSVKGYVVIANINSRSQAVIGGASTAVEQAIQVFTQAGYEVSELPVSHAFHTSIVAPASEPLREMLQRLHLLPPRVPIVANLNGEFYPAGPNVVPEMLDILAKQVASPVQFLKGLQTLYEAGARVFVEVGPKKALQGFAEDVLGDRGDIVSLFTNHPKFGDVPSFNQALCGLYAVGLGRGRTETEAIGVSSAKEIPAPALFQAASVPSEPSAPLTKDRYTELGRMFADVLERGWQMYRGQQPPASTAPVVITGAALGLPGTEHVFDDENIGRLLRGEQFIDVIPRRFRQAMLDKNITRLVKSDNGGPTFETITDLTDVIKLAGRGGNFDLQEEFGITAERIPALDRVTQLAIAAGIDALRDAGIPLVMRYKTTTKGTQLPERWGLPEGMCDDTGVIFASAFPGCDSLIDELSRYYADHARREQLTTLESVRTRVIQSDGRSGMVQEIDRRIAELRAAIAKEPYVFDRRFLFRTLAMGHSQFAEYIGARGPNTQINSACASTTQAIALAQDWIQTGRCRRVIVISADDVTSDHMLEWFAAGFLATGAAATDEVVEEAAIPFDRRRHGMLIGMGAAALVIEAAEVCRERGVHPICEILSTVTANSAFHATRLDVPHIGQVMEELISKTEARHGISRKQIAPQAVFVSHETYTPARGGSASAEIHALRRVFGDFANQIVIANTKGFTGHAMATGIEDVLAVKALETGMVPPVANFKEIDPELGELNLSKGGVYPIEYALHLGAGFGSQISMMLLRWVKTNDGLRRSPNALGYEYRIADSQAWHSWLARVAGSAASELEIVHRTLRVKNHGASARTPEAGRAASTAVPPTAPLPVLQRATEARPAAPVAQLVPVAVPEAKPSFGAAAESKSPVTRTVPVENSPADQVKDHVLALVSQKTGYPIDMLDVDLDLEADLGVDTVKQAEVFATIREAYAIPRDEKVKLRDFPTLAHVIRFVHERRSDIAPLIPAPIPAPTSQLEPAFPVKPTPAAESEAVRERILALVVEKTGYPKDMLDLDLDLEADLGVDTVKQAEMFAAIREIYNIPRDPNLKLRDFPTLAHVIGFVYKKRPDLSSAVPVSQAQATPPATANESAGSPVAATTATDDEINQKILDIVAEKTGYPKDMLDLDLDLEADLGIDTVKQAEMFASVRAAFNIPRDPNLKLRDFPTLAHVIKFARDRQSTGASGLAEKVRPELAEKKPPVSTAVPTTVTVTRPVAASFEVTNRIPRRVPVPVLRPPLSRCKLTGVSLVSGRRVLIMADRNGVADNLIQQLRDRGAEPIRTDAMFDADSLAQQLQKCLATGPLHGIYWLPALDPEESLNRMDLTSWHEALWLRLKSLYTCMRTLYQHIDSPETFLIAATRLGGQHGYDPDGAVAPLGGAVAGFTKTFKRERPDALVKIVDFELGAEPSGIADLLVQETLRDPGAVEIGYKARQRWTVGLQEQSSADGQSGLTLDQNTIFVVTGAAGSIVSAITADLATASGGTFYLLDIVPEPAADNPDLERLVSDKEGLKRELFTRIQGRGERATPALVEKELAALERAQAAGAAIDAVHAAGGKAHYFSVNLTDADAVARVVDEVRKRSGRIDVLLHAAGMERSHFLPDKDPREFALVFDVKADGFFNLLHAIGDMPLGATVAFSSIAGRFGNAGQADYSSANDLLCKITSSFRTVRPTTRAIAIDWTAWSGIGMATRGSIPKMMEVAGIDMLSPEAGIPLIRRELTAGGTRGEIVIGQRLGVLLNEWDQSGGLDPSMASVSEPLAGPMTGKITAMGVHNGLVIETTLDPAVQPFLRDHAMEGTPLLPGVMGIEAFGEAAQYLLPDWQVAAVEDVNFLAPFKFYRSEPRTVTVRSIIRPAGEDLLADCQLTGSRSLPNQAQSQITTHFTGRVLLTRQRLQTASIPVPITRAGTSIERHNIYPLFFHGPAYRVLQQAWWDGKRVLGLMAEDLPPNHDPADLPLIATPRLVELCFQTAGLWDMGVQGRLGLPFHIDRLAFCDTRATMQAPIYAVVIPGPGGDSFNAQVVDGEGKLHLTLHGYRTVALPGAVDEMRLKSLQTAMSLRALAA